MLRDGVSVADKHFDAWKQTCNATFDGGMRFLLTDNASKVPTLSKVYDRDGFERSMGPSDIVRLAHCPYTPLSKGSSKLFGCFSGSIDDPLLTSVSCSDTFGERAVLVLDRMPPRNRHSFVSLVQVDQSFQRRKIENNFLSVILSCGDFQRGGWGHHHDGFSCHFGKHHKYRNYVDDFSYRPPGSLSDEVSYIYFIFS